MSSWMSRRGASGSRRSKRWALTKATATLAARCLWRLRRTGGTTGMPRASPSISTASTQATSGTSTTRRTMTRRTPRPRWCRATSSTSSTLTCWTGASRQPTGWRRTPTAAGTPASWCSAQALPTRTSRSASSTRSGRPRSGVVSSARTTAAYYTCTSTSNAHATGAEGLTQGTTRLGKTADRPCSAGQAACRAAEYGFWAAASVSGLYCQSLQGTATAAQCCWRCCGCQGVSSLRRPCIADVHVQLSTWLVRWRAVTCSAAGAVWCQWVDVCCAVTLPAAALASDGDGCCIRLVAHLHTVRSRQATRAKLCRPRRGDAAGGCAAEH